MSQPSSNSTTPYKLYKYTRGATIGRGTSAVVYSGSYIDSTGIKHRIALKTTSSEQSISLRRERTIMETLQGCPEIIGCFGGGEYVERGKKFYNLLLEFAPAGTLNSLIAKSGGLGLPEIEARVYTKMILKALDCMHSRGYVHCDIKPENILVFPSDHSPYKYELKLGDFGLSVGPGERRWRGGTPEYMSPEAAMKKEAVPSFDVWSLGCTLVEIITGKKPWFGRMRVGATIVDYVRVLGTKSPAIPERMSECGKDFLRKCFERDVRKRWTVKMLLGHPYVTGFVLGRPRETKEAVTVGRFVLPNEKIIRGV